MEDAIAKYLSCNGRAFICPQYTIAWDPVHQDGGSCPDFVALDFQNRDAVVVEVTTSASINSLLERLVERDTRWLVPLRRRLIEEKVIDNEWPSARVIAFIRAELIDGARKRFSDTSVTFVSIEDAIVPWKYWDDRQRGLPRAEL